MSQLCWPEAHNGDKFIQTLRQTVTGKGVTVSLPAWPVQQLVQGTCHP